MPTLRVFFVTRLRGFFKQLFSAKDSGIEFNYNHKAIYETNTAFNLKKTLGHSRLADYLGLVQSIRCGEQNCDVYGSFNRFLNVNKPYFIYVENPTALYHYRLRRRNSILGRLRLKRLINNPNLRCLVFMSHACASTFEKVCTPIPKQCATHVIYPYIPVNKNINCEIIKTKSGQPIFKLLYIAQGTRFLSKGALEISEAFKRLKGEGMNISLQMITSISDVSAEVINRIREINGITISDFKYSYEELQEIYASCHLLLQPSSDDSSPLTILEAIKSGLPILSSRLYAIPEMVEDGYNGFLCNPHYWYFDKDNIPVPEIWNHPHRNIYSGKISVDIIDFLVDKIGLLYNNRELWLRMAHNSLDKASSKPFATDYIISQWKHAIRNLVSQK